MSAQLLQRSQQPLIEAIVSPKLEPGLTLIDELAQAGFSERRVQAPNQELGLPAPCDSAKL